MMNLMDQMAPEYRPLIAAAVSLAASVLVFIPGKHIRTTARGVVSLIAAVFQTIIIYSMVPAVLAGRELRLEVFSIAKGISFSFNADPAGMVFACIASTLWILISFYSIGYVRGREEKFRNGWHAAAAMCLSATIGICFAANLTTFFIFYELLAIAAYPIISRYNEDGTKASGSKYLAYMLISGVLFLVAIILVYSNAGTTEFVPGGFFTEEMLPASLAPAVFFMMVFAGMVYAGVMPLHGWLPAAMSASAPAGALLCAVSSVNAGVFCIFRVILYVFGTSMTRTFHGSDIIAWMAALTIVLSSLAAMRETDLKTRLSYSTMGQVSNAVLAVCIFSPFCTAGALYQLAAHSILNIILFMSAGAIFVAVNKQDITDIAGVGRKMPVTMAAFAAASIGVAGFPFFACFVSKANIIYGAVAMGNAAFTAAIILDAVLSLACLMPVVLIAFRNDINDQGCEEKTEANLCMLIPIVIAVLISVLLGIAPDFGLHLFEMSLMAGNSIFTPLM